MEPASQWYRAGTVFHCFANATMAPASNTPNPNKWLNSNPTPFIVQWNRPFASNNEFRLDVRTVRCWMSLQDRSLLQLETSHVLAMPNISIITLLQVLEQKHQRLLEPLLKYQNDWWCTFHTNLLLPERRMLTKLSLLWVWKHLRRLCLDLWLRCWMLMLVLMNSSRHSGHFDHHL